MKRFFVCLLSLSLLSAASCAVSESVDSLIEASVAAGDMPGAVLCVASVDESGRLEQRITAYGKKALFGSVEVMTESTLFDLASLSKPVGAGLAVLRLAEEGRIALDSPVSRYLPDYEGDATVTDLLTHTSGLPAYAQWKQLTGGGVPLMLCGEEEAVRRKALLRVYLEHCNRLAPPASEFRYSCLNFITLQLIVEAVTDMGLDEYTRRYVFEPLGMLHTGYRPVLMADTANTACIAPTEALPVSLFTEAFKEQNKRYLYHDSICLCGVVHDPLAREMNGGVSGNAGVFSTVQDLLLLGEWMLGLRQVNDAVMTAVQRHALFFEVPQGYESFGRTYGWDAYSDYSSCKGVFAPKEAICHTGYTGTSMVVDPVNKRIIILLTNRVHPYDGGGVISLRKKLANAVYENK